MTDREYGERREQTVTEFVPGAQPYTCWVIDTHEQKQVDMGVIAESLLSLYVNGQELATIMCSPIDQEALAVGFLVNEGVITSMADIAHLRPNLARTVMDVFLKRADFEPPRRMILTSGCGGGITLQQLGETYPALDSAFTTTPEIIFARMREMQGAAHLYHQVRGVHTAALANVDRLLTAAEDVGRHNAVDKVAGKALMAGINTRDGLLLTSGRISSEMLTKARRMNIPIVASRTSPTSISLALAKAWNLCVIGYVRQGGMRVYTHPERLGLPQR